MVVCRPRRRKKGVERERKRLRRTGANKGVREREKKGLTLTQKLNTNRKREQSLV